MTALWYFTLSTTIRLLVRRWGISSHLSSYFLITALVELCWNLLIDCIVVLLMVKKTQVIGRKAGCKLTLDHSRKCHFIIVIMRFRLWLEHPSYDIHPPHPPIAWISMENDPAGPLLTTWLIPYSIWCCMWVQPCFIKVDDRFPFCQISPHSPELIMTLVVEHPLSISSFFIPEASFLNELINKGASATLKNPSLEALSS